LPKDLPSGIKLVFLDPPYWKQAENKYSKDKEDLANMTLDKFYETIIEFIKQLKKKLTDNGKIAMIIQGTQYKNNMVLEDHAFEIAKQMDKIGFKIQQRFICPYSTEQYNAQMVEKAKREKICLTIYRDLIIFEQK
jgi:tRNA1(Val) A37 N6-methylase TrmN6